MHGLLYKRLARSLWRTKLRLFAVLAMVAIGVMAGISFGSYAQNAETLYAHIYADTDDGVNLPDLWVENAGSTWDGPTADEMCEHIAASWPDADLPLKQCEARLRLPGLLFHTDEDGESKQVTGIWHGIDEGQVHRVWMPEHETVSGRLAEADNEIVLDAHAALGMNIAVDDTVRLGAGAGPQEYTVVGIGYHGEHLYFAEKGDIMPASAGTLVTGYLTAAGLERLAEMDAGSSNFLLLDIEGSPPYDLQSTPENEGEALADVVESLSGMVSENSEVPVLVYDRSAVYSVELLRADAEGAQLTFPYVTGMLALVAGITIFLSLQRLIQSQAREIAILKTLGIGRKILMPAYIVAPLVIGVLGAVVGVALGVGLGAPGMQAMYEDIIGVPVVVDGLTNALVFQNVVIAMIMVFFSGLWPSWKAAQLQPLEVLRGQHDVRLGSRRIQRLTARLPATIGLTIRSSIRRPLRLCFTFVGVGISMLLFGSMLVMMGAMDDLATGGFANKETWDAQVQVFPGKDAPVVEWAESKGAEHELLLQFPANPEDDPRQFIATGHEKLGTEAGDSLSLVKLKDGELPKESQEISQVLIDEGTAVFLEWKIGETRKVMFGDREKEVEITGITQGEMMRTVHFHRTDLAEAVGIPATSVMLTLPDGVQVDDDLGSLSLGITLRQAQLDTFAEMMDKQKKFFNAILFLGILIATVVLFNTLLMNLAERDQELATLRVLGAPIGRLGTMLFLEHLVIGIIGGLIGCLFSFYGAQLMIEASVQWAFYFTVKADPSALGIILGTVVFISVALTPFGMWRIRKMDLVEKVKAQG